MSRRVLTCAGTVVNLSLKLTSRIGKSTADASPHLSTTIQASRSARLASHNSPMATLSHHRAESKHKDGVEWLLEDHKHILALFDKYNETTSAEAKLAIVRQLVKDVSGHASAEERCAYPLITQRLSGLRPDAAALYDRNVMDDQINKDMLHWIETHIPKNQEEWQIFDRTVKKFETIEREHLQQEEETWMPSLKLALSQPELDKLWDDLDWARRNAPTHPHPGGPSQAPMANVLHPVAGAVDKAWDAMTGKA